MDLTTLAETIDAFERKYPKKMPLQLRCLVDALDETLEAILPVTFARLARLGAAFIGGLSKGRRSTTRFTRTSP